MVRTLRRFTMAAMAMAALAPAGASAQVLTSQSGWFWGDPQPQGQNLTDIDFAGARGYAVGSFGTALRTDDGGATWRGLRVGTTTTLFQVEAVDANSVIAGGGCSVRRSVDGGATFTRLPFTSSEESCPAQVAAFDFVDASVGYITLENGTVIRTADGGRSFSQRTPLPGTPAANSGGSTVEAIAFTGVNSGVAVLSNRVYRTTDGGNTWTLATGTTGTMRAIDFATSTTGFVVGESGVVLRTEDGGATFAARPFTGGAAGQSLTSIDCVSATTCLMPISGGDRLARTTDGGATSTAVSPSGPALVDVGFASATRAVAVGVIGTTVVSNDAGANFTPIGGSLSGDFDFLVATRGRVYAPGANGRVARSLNGGRRWDVIGVSTSSRIADVSFPTSDVGFALDTGGTALRTDNAGESWQILNTGASGNPRALLAVDPRQVILAGPRGIRRSGDGGQSFGAVRSSAVRTKTLGALDRAGRAVIAYGERTLAASTNAGSTWRALRRPPGRIAQADFISAGRGFVLTTAGRVYSTANGGKRWREVQTGNRATGLAFADSRRGWISAAAGAEVLRTADGGRSWQPQDVSENGVTSIVALAGTSAAAYDGQGQRFYATTGGGGIGAPSRLSLAPSKGRLTRRGTIRIRGRLRPARGGELVSVLSRDGTRWSRRTVRAASNGTFTLTYRVRRSTLFLTQWSGDDRSAGDGSTVVKVTVKKRKRKRR